MKINLYNILFTDLAENQNRTASLTDEPDWYKKIGNWNKPPHSLRKPLEPGWLQPWLINILLQSIKKTQKENIVKRGL